MTPPEPKKRKIGFLVEERAVRYGKRCGAHFHVSGIPETWEFPEQSAAKGQVERLGTGLGSYERIAAVARLERAQYWMAQRSNACNEWNGELHRSRLHTRYQI